MRWPAVTVPSVRLSLSIGRRWKLLGGFGGVAALLLASSYQILMTDSPLPAEPRLSAPIRAATIRIGNLDRSYLFYVPTTLTAHPALLFALHGARMTGRRMRVLTAYEFDALADAHNFIVVYPDGFEKYWNDCRRHGAYAAKTHSVDDVAFIHALIDHFRVEFAIDATRVFVMGFSNGGQMAYRLALELPGEIAAVVAVAANLPISEDCECTPSQRSIAVMIVDGTADPINPYEGGKQGWFGLGNQSRLRSASETASYFSQRAGRHALPEVERYPERDGDLRTWVERTKWAYPGEPEVDLYTVRGGGHTIPGSPYRLRRILGRTDADIDCMQESWAFFERQIQNPAMSR